MVLKLDEALWTFGIEADVRIRLLGDLPDNFFSRVQHVDFHNEHVGFLDEIEDVLKYFTIEALLGRTDVSQIQGWTDVPPGRMTFEFAERPECNCAN